MTRLKPIATFEELSQRYGDRYKWIVLMILAAGTVAGVLCATSFNVAIPALSRNFNLGQDQVQWSVTGFLAAMTIAMLPTSWLLDRLGFRVVFLIALFILVLASIVGFFAPTFSLVVLARIMQGAAAGVLQPMGTMALMRLFAPHIQGRASGILIFSMALPPALAPSLAGLLLDQFGWEFIFLLGMPFAIVAALAAIYLLPAPRVIKSLPFDWIGLSWLTLGTITLVEGVSCLQSSGWLSPWTIFQFAIFLISTGFYIRQANNCDFPIISLKLFIGRTFSLGTLVSLAHGFGFYASIYLIPVYLQNALSYSAGASGLALLPSGISLLLVLPLAGWMSDYFSPKWLTFSGLMIFGTSFAVFALLGGDIRYVQIILATVMGRVGLGMILPALNLATLRHMESHQLGQASVVVSFARQLGGVLGVAVMAVFVEWRQSVYSADAPGIIKAYEESFMALAVVLGIASLAALFMRLEPQPAIRSNC
jgi:MFS transporter, DHA2 family, multidrug resistance protein